MGPLARRLVAATLAAAMIPAGLLLAVEYFVAERAGPGALGGMAGVGARALALVTGALLAGAVVAGVARDLERRLSLLARATERVGAGDLTVRVRPRGGDAVDALMGRFNQMVEEIALSRARVDYLQRIAGWQEFARRLAHEIKNPLTPIQLAAQELARKYTGDDPKYQRTLATATEVITEEVATLRRLVSAFSDFAKLPEVIPAPADLAEFVREMASARALIDEAEGGFGGDGAGTRTEGTERSPPRSMASPVKVEFVAGSEAIAVKVDRMMLRRAVENLVRNAAQAIGARGGTVWVRSEQRAVTGAVTASGPEETVEQAWLVVEDDGPGIPRAQQARVFDAYYTTRSETGGTGLGLAIVRKIALDHGGDVGLEDRPGGGARFVITLPLAAPGKSPRLSFVTWSKNPGEKAVTPSG